MRPIAAHVIDLARGPAGLGPRPPRRGSAARHLTAAQPARLAIAELHAGFGGEDVLGDLYLTVQPGELVAVTGPSGSGKSTLLRAVMGLVPARGCVRFDGVDVSSADAFTRSRLAAYLPQDPSCLLFAETVADELAVTLGNHGLAAPPAGGAVAPEELLRRLGIHHLAGRYPRDLSTGERQRAALASVTVTGARLWLLDEPTRGLDDDAIDALVDLLRTAAADGAAIVVATHDRRLWSQADRVLRLSGGYLTSSARSSLTGTASCVSTSTAIPSST
jgi:energy-coupling factor transport system ATP-binding protein